jgi:hypothetical protein
MSAKKALKWTGIGCGGVLLLVIVLAALFGVDEEGSDTAVAALATTAPTTAPTDVHLIWDEYQEDEAAAKAKYKGKRTIMTCFVKDVLSASSESKVRVVRLGDLGGDLAVAWAKFPDKESVANLAARQQITFEGEVEAFVPIVECLEIGNCKLIEQQGKPSSVAPSTSQTTNTPSKKYSLERSENRKQIDGGGYIEFSDSVYSEDLRRILATVTNKSKHRIKLGLVMFQIIDPRGSRGNIGAAEVKKGTDYISTEDIIIEPNDTVRLVSISEVRPGSFRSLDGYYMRTFETIGQ